MSGIKNGAKYTAFRLLMDDKYTKMVVNHNGSNTLVTKISGFSPKPHRRILRKYFLKTTDLDN